jgi:hypothetical protein
MEYFIDTATTTTNANATPLAIAKPAIPLPMSIDDFLNDDNNNDNEDVDVDVVEVSDDGAQSPNNGFIDLALAESIQCIAACFGRKRDGLGYGGKKDISVFNAGNTEHHASPHLRMKPHRQIPAWFKS